MTTQIVDAIEAWSTDALTMVAPLITAGLAMWGVPVLIGFGKRIFGAAR